MRRARRTPKRNSDYNVGDIVEVSNAPSSDDELAVPLVTCDRPCDRPIRNASFIFHIIYFLLIDAFL